MYKAFTKFLLEGMDMPEENVPGQPILELFGEDRILVENHRGIKEYGHNCISICVSYGMIRVTGQSLHLCRMQKGQLIIKGSIEAVNLIRR